MSGFLSSLPHPKKIDSLRPGGRGFDWILFGATIPLLAAGLVTMNSLTGISAYFGKQVIVVLLSLVLCFGLSFIDFRFLRRTQVLITLYLGIVFVLCALFVVGSVVKGAQSWIHFGLFSFQPSDPAKLVLIVVLAKYFSRRHIEIANVRHILVSGVYAFILFLLILVQPDFGSAFIIFMIWFGMVLVSGISKKHLALVATIGLVSFALLWAYALKPYQKQRIMTFVAPQTNISSTGYNAYQSTIAVGSGQILGKGLGFGTQSRLNFLPEYQTDFIFAAFAEEWGLIGALILFMLYLVVMWRILINALYGASNFEILFGLGLAIYLMTQFTINVGMNIGVLPVTGLAAPFMSYGGSHLITEFIGIGIVMGMRRYSKPAHKELMKNEFLGVE